MSQTYLYCSSAEARTTRSPTTPCPASTAPPPPVGTPATRGRARAGEGEEQQELLHAGYQEGCPSASSTLSLDTGTDFASAYAEGRFLERALSATAAQGFSTHRAAHTAYLPIGGRLHEARQVWNLVNRNAFVQGVCEPRIQDPLVQPAAQVPQDGRNPPTSEDGKEILDREVKAMLKKRAIRVADLKVPGAISGFFARPKKKLGEFRPIISMKYTSLGMER